VEGGEEVKCYCLEGDSFSFFSLLAPLDSASEPLGLCLAKKLSSVICFVLVSYTNAADADARSLSLQDVDGLRVRNSKHSTSSETLCVRKMCS